MIFKNLHLYNKRKIIFYLLIKNVKNQYFFTLEEGVNILLNFSFIKNNKEANDWIIDLFVEQFIYTADLKNFSITYQGNIYLENNKTEIEKYIKEVTYNV